MQAAFQPQCQSCRLRLLMAYKGRHCLLVTSASLQNVKKKKKKRRRCCCGSSSPRTTTPLLPEERSPFSGFLLCFSGDYQLTCAAASSKGEGKYASSKQLLQRVARQLLQLLLRWLQVLYYDVIGLYGRSFPLQHGQCQCVVLNLSWYIRRGNPQEDTVFHPCCWRRQFLFPPAFPFFPEKEKFCPSSLHPRH